MRHCQEGFQVAATQLEPLLVSKSDLEHGGVAAVGVDVSVQLLVADNCDVWDQPVCLGTRLVEELGQVPGEFHAGVVKGEVVFQTIGVWQGEEGVVVEEVAKGGLQLLPVLLVEEEVDHHLVLPARLQVLEHHLLHLLTRRVVVIHHPLDLIVQVSPLLEDGDGDSLGTDGALNLDLCGGRAYACAVDFLCKKFIYQRLQLLKNIQLPELLNLNIP